MPRTILGETVRGDLVLRDEPNLEDDLRCQLNVAGVSDFGVARQAREQAAKVAIIRVVDELTEAIAVGVREIEHLHAQLHSHSFRQFGLLGKRQISRWRRVQSNRRITERRVAWHEAGRITTNHIHVIQRATIKVRAERCQ